MATAPTLVSHNVFPSGVARDTYSAAMAPHWRDTPRWWRALAAYLLVDPSLAVGIDGCDRHRQGRVQQRRHDWETGGNNRASRSEFQRACPKATAWSSLTIRVSDATGPRLVELRSPGAQVAVDD